MAKKPDKDAEPVQDRGDAADQPAGGEAGDAEGSSTQSEQAPSATPPGGEAAGDPSPDVDAAEEKPATKPRRRRRKSEPEAGAAKDVAATEEAEAEAAEAQGEPEAEDERAEPAARPRRGGEVAAGQTQRKPSAPRTPDGRVQVRARARYVRCAPRKARLVVDHIRGKPVDEARAILTHTPRAASRDVLKLLNSAIANAENNHELVADDLKVGQAYVDEGPTLKRYRPRALGRATRIRKRTSHMTIELTAKE